MPEYLAPGVYVEETSFRSKSIEGVSTTTTGFIGPTRWGPVDLDLDIITSLGEFERTYGDGERLKYGDLEMDNFMWHAARAFFTEGGKRLYVSRVFKAGSTPGTATKKIGGVEFRARYPGAFGNFTLRLTLKAGRNLVGREEGPGGTARATLGALSDRDLIWIRDDTGSPATPAGDLYVAHRDPAATPFPWKFTSADSPSMPFTLTDQPDDGLSLRILTVTLELLDKDGLPLTTWTDLPIDPQHRTAGLPDSLFAQFEKGREFRAVPIVVTAAGMSGSAVLSALFNAAELDKPGALEKGVSRQDIRLEGGSDGDRPGVGEYEGKDDPDKLQKTGLKQLEALDDISIVAAPGCTWNYAAYRDDANAIIGQLIAHARNMRYRVAIIDCAQNQTISDVRKMRAKIDSKYAALYFPWVRIMDPITRRVISLPPSGFVAGIYARNDIERAVFKAPANEVVTLALGFDMLLSKSQQDVLNPEGINCFRFFEGRGMLVWGARTISSDPEWKYLNLRRYFAYLEHSIDKGTQWAVFEPNGERLWANVRRTVYDFLLNEWQMGAMLGDKPEKAFFVKCDRTTMTQNDIDNGRLVCLVGAAVVKPAEFVIFRIGQWTADHKV